MKIAVLSMQRIINYGSFLQAYALKTILESFGNEVGFIDIRDGEYHETPTSLPSGLIYKLKLHGRHLLKWVRFRKINKEVNQIIRDAQAGYLGLTPARMEHAPETDAVLIGSDEVFNCAPKSSWGVSTQLFGDIDVPAVLSYAASCGYTVLSDIPKEYVGKIGRCLKRMKVVSVRDENTHAFVQEASGIDALSHADPVILYDFKEEVLQAERRIAADEPYMIIYAYSNRINKKSEIEAIKRYAKEHHLKTYCVGGMLSWCDRFPRWDPFEVLAGFKHADCIVTDTFHGTIMAAKYNKPFAVLIRESNKNKLNDLLQRFELISHRVDNVSVLASVLSQPLTYDAFNRRVTEERTRGLDYLKRYFS